MYVIVCSEDFIIVKTSKNSVLDRITFGSYENETSLTLHLHSVGIQMLATTNDLPVL